MKTAALVMGTPDQVRYDLDSFLGQHKGFDTIIGISGEPHEIEKWQKAAAETDADIVGFFLFNETIEGPLFEVVEKMRTENKRVALLPHNRVETTYRLRLARKPLPEHLEEFLWPTVDPSKLMGLVNYHGFVATNVFTIGAPAEWPKRECIGAGGMLEAAWMVERDDPPWHSEDSAFALFAKASLLAPWPEAFFGLARCAVERFQPREAIAQTERGLIAAREIMNILPWNRMRRFVFPITKAILVCLAQHETTKARWFLEQGRELGPKEYDAWSYEEAAVAVAEASDKVNAPCITFPVVPGNVRPPGVDQLYEHGFSSFGNCREIYSRASLIPDGPWSAYVLPLEPPSLDSAELRGLYRADGLIAVSEFHAEQYRRAYPFLRPDFIKVCPLGFVPFSDRVQQDKSLDLAIGIGGDLNEVEKAVFERIHIGRGFSFAPGAVQMAKVFLHIPMDEPYFCTEVLQAQAAGAVPVVAGVGCLPELVKGGYFYRPPVTSEAFINAVAERICYLLTHESDRLAAAEEGPAPSFGRKYLGRGGSDLEKSTEINTYLTCNDVPCNFVTST